MFHKILLDCQWWELNAVRIIFALYTIGFLYGTKNHIEDIIQDGLLGYQYVPFPVNLYWTLLTVLDPLAIILLVFLPFWRMTFSVWIMATDIAVNLSVAWYYDWPTGVFADGRLGLQIAFGLFVFFTCDSDSSEFCRDSIGQFLVNPP